MMEGCGVDYLERLSVEALQSIEAPLRVLGWSLSCKRAELPEGNNPNSPQLVVPPLIATTVNSQLRHQRLSGYKGFG